MEFPRDRFYSEHHLWVKQDGDRVVIGITAFAVEELGKADYIEFFDNLHTMAKDEPFCAIETSKAVTDLIAPISGMVEATNAALGESPNLVTDDPYGSGWLAQVKPSMPDEMLELLNPEYYESLVGNIREV